MGSDDRLSFVVGQAPILVYELDAQGRFTFCAGQVLEKIGVKAADLVGQSAFDVYGGFSATLESGETTDNATLLRRGLAGERVRGISGIGGFFGQFESVPQRDANGVVTGIIGCAVDVTARVYAEQGLRLAHDKLAAMVRSAPVLMMPFTNGWQFREAQLADPALAGLPIVILSGRDGVEENAARIGAAGWLVKPVALETLLEAVRRFG